MLIGVSELVEGCYRGCNYNPTNEPKVNLVEPENPSNMYQKLNLYKKD